jgi:hypothetical protein
MIVPLSSARVNSGQLVKCCWSFMAQLQVDWRLCLKVVQDILQQSYCLTSSVFLLCFHLGCDKSRQIMSSSSSSDDEDLHKFASCAVSADQIEKTVVEEAQKRALNAARRSISTPSVAAKPATAATAASAGAGQLGDTDEPASTGLDLISVRVSYNHSLCRGLLGLSCTVCAVGVGVPNRSTPKVFHSFHSLARTHCT